MVVYMLRKKGTKAYYRAARGGFSWCWVDQPYASVWTTKQGVAGAIGHLRRYHRNRNNMPTLEVVEFSLTEIGTTEK